MELDCGYVLDFEKEYLRSASEVLSLPIFPGKPASDYSKWRVWWRGGVHEHWPLVELVIGLWWEPYYRSHTEALWQCLPGEATLSDQIFSLPSIGLETGGLLHATGAVIAGEENYRENVNWREFGIECFVVEKFSPMSRWTAHNDLWKYTGKNIYDKEFVGAVRVEPITVPHIPA